jgi:hypothetical protein
MREPIDVTVGAATAVVRPKTPRQDMLWGAMRSAGLAAQEREAEALGVPPDALDSMMGAMRFMTLSVRVADLTGVDFDLACAGDDPDTFHRKWRAFLDTAHGDFVDALEAAMDRLDAPHAAATAPDPPADPAGKSTGGAGKTRTSRKSTS